MEVSLVQFILLLPLIGFLFHAFLGGAIVRALGAKQGKWIIGLVASGAALGAFGISAQLFSQMMAQEESNRSAVFMLGSWIQVGSLSIPFEFIVDPLSLMMCLIITGIGGLIHVYATGYMAEEEDYPRFFTYFNLFLFFMLTLVLANNFPLMFIGWEGVGLCSYLLIGFFYRNKEWRANTDAANKAFIVNRIGDFGFILAMMMIFAVFGTLSFSEVGQQAATLLSANSGIAIAIALLLFLAAAGKSAQLPLYFWLPDAMAGPTPVSALIHAATMVTAGVYLVARVHPLFEVAPAAMTVMAVTGAFTAIFAATIALAQTDIKKVLAYSTVSQLGYMFLACGVGAFWVGMFHVATHAFFKALLFLGAGSVLIALHHQQDMRFMGGLSKPMRITFFTMVVGLLAIAGIPPLSGFWSKEAILIYTAASPLNGMGQVLFFVGAATAFLTALYMARMVALTFLGKPRWDQAPRHEDDHHHAHPIGESHPPKERYWVVLGTLVVLAIGSILFGFVLPSEHAFHDYLKSTAEATILSKEQLGDPDSVRRMVTFVALFAGILGLFWGFAQYIKGLSKREAELQGVWGWANRQWGYDGAMRWLGVGLGGFIARFCYLIIETIIDGIVNSIGSITGGVGAALRYWQTGYVRTYAFTMLIGVAVVLLTAFLLGR